MSQWRKILAERISRWGAVRFVSVHVLIWVMLYGLVDGTWIFFGANSNVHFFRDIFEAVVVGALVGVWNWADLEKHREIEATKRAGLDATMI